MRRRIVLKGQKGLNFGTTPDGIPYMYGADPAYYMVQRSLEKVRKGEQTLGAHNRMAMSTAIPRLAALPGPHNFNFWNAIKGHVTEPTLLNILGLPTASVLGLASAPNDILEEIIVPFDRFFYETPLLLELRIKLSKR